MTHQQTILITGGTSGIGKATALALAKQGSIVVFTARTEEAGSATQREIVEQSGNPAVSYLVADLASLVAVRTLAEQVAAQYPAMNVLINNAGVLTQERQESQDGIELDLAVNFLAPFLLTNLFLPLLKKNAPARIVNVASSMHAEGEIDFDDLEGKKDFNRYKAYAQSKLALLLFTKKLARDLAGTGVTANALHPGVIGTEMTMQNVRKMNPLAAFFFKRTLVTPEEGAQTSVYLATAPEVAGVSGEYWSNKKVITPAPQALDEATGERLWEVAAKLVGL